jgi:succinoglycan biosynthesis protein ExoM
MPLLPDVEVGIATFRRPAQLAQTLASVATQTYAPSRIIVVDNDAVGSARGIVETFAANSSLAVHYAIEPRQNIALARNRVLAEAQAPYVAFIDDDETAASDWLAALVTAAVRLGADAVFGRVDAVLQPMAPRWIRAGAFFQRPRVPTGTPVNWGSSANALYRLAAIRSLERAFDPRYGRTGGEDLDLSRRLFLAGCSLRACDEAIVTESVPATRTTLRWLTRRAFRGGQSHADVYRRNRKPLHRAGHATGRALAALLVAPVAVAWALVDRSRGIRLWLRVVGWLGQAAAALPWRYEEYRVRG